MATGTTVTKRRTPPPRAERSSRDDPEELLGPPTQEEESGSMSVVSDKIVVSSFLKKPCSAQALFQCRNNNKASTSKSFVSLHVKLSSLVFGVVWIVWWLYLDPVLHHAVTDHSNDDHHNHRAVVNSQREVIYPRTVVLYVYDHDALGKESSEARHHHQADEQRAVTNSTNKERQERNYLKKQYKYYAYSSVVKVKPLTSNFRQSYIKDSEDYRGLDILDTAKVADCQVKYEWQRSNRLNCNSMFEATDLTTAVVVPVPATSTGGTTEQQESRYQFLANGYFRDVLMLLDSSPHTTTKIVFKPMRYEHDFDSRNFARMRRDALTMDQLTGAKHVLNIYANCGTSGLFEYADGGDIKDAIWFKKDDNSLPTQMEKRPLTQMEKLHIATQAAMGLASFHNMDEEGKASVAHTDISPSQFIKVNGVYKLNDFNRARFLKYSTSTGTVCPFYNENNWGSNRAPEEYLHGPETEMVDIYSFGNIMYMLLQGDWPFVGILEEEAMDKVANGIRPSIDADIWNSTDPVDHVLKHARIMCHAQEPHERKTARQIETYLKNSMRKLDPGRLEEWGDA